MSAAMMDRFKVSSLGMRPRVPDSGCKRKCNDEARRSPTAPRGISHHRSRPVSGLVGSGVSPSRRLAPTVAGWIRPHALTVAGAAEALAGEPAAPPSRFTPARGTRRDTSNERVDCTTQVTGRTPAAQSGIYIENESLHLDLTGFSKL